MSDASLIKRVRSMSGAGMMDCKKALIESKGDVEKAVEALRQKGLAKADKRVGRETAVGRVFSYIHGEGNIGVLLQLNCETDFVARNEDFAILGHDLCLQVAAANPLVVSDSDLDPTLISREEDIIREQLAKEGKKNDMIEKILPGKIKKFCSEVCLQEQSYIKDTGISVNDLLKQSIAKFGENITVARFDRYQVG